MYLYLVHHADAVGPGVDPQRPLSALGQRQAAWLAGHARARDVRPAAIWHSGKLRSRQTAEQFLRQCNPSAGFKAARGLQPEDPTLWMENAVALEEQDLLLVGHMPHLPALAHALGATEVLPLNGMIAFERVDIAQFAPRWSARPPDDVAQQASGRPGGSGAGR